MKSAVTPPIRTVDDAERFRARAVESIQELQLTPLARAIVVSDVELPDATEVVVPHKLGRAPKWVSSSIPRGSSSAGRIDDLTRDRSIDRTRFLVLKASGYGATVTVDVVVL